MFNCVPTIEAICMLVTIHLRSASQQCLVVALTTLPTIESHMVPYKYTRKAFQQFPCTLAGDSPKWNISRHTVVCRAALESGKNPARHSVSILTGRTKTSFSHLCISVITYLIGTKFATQFPASQGSLHSKFEGNRSSHFRDTSCQSFVFFPSFFSLLLRLFAHLQKLL